MIRNIVFDIGNVLAGFNYRKYLDSLGLTEDRKETVAGAVFEGPYWKEMDRGIWTEEEICEKCAELAPEEEVIIREVFRNGIEQLVEEYPFSEAWLKQLRERGYHVYLLSNYGKRGFAWALEHFTFICQAEDMVISYRENLLKPDEAIYCKMLERFGIRPEETVFLDDTEANVRAAEKLGIHGIHVKSHDEAVQLLEAALKN